MSTPKTKIFVGHLPDGCTDDDLRALFEKHGEVTECDVINKYGFVHMATPEQANEAVKQLNNYNLKGSTISVEPSKSKLHPEPGAPGRANKQTVMSRRGGGGPSRNGYGPPRGGFGGGFSNGYSRRFDGPPMGGESFHDRPFGFGRDRMRPYPPPFERRSPNMPPMRDEYPRRPLPPMSSDPYSRPLPPLSMRDDLYERRPMPERSDYLYSRRSPPLTSMRSPYWYDSMQNGFIKLLSCFITDGTDTHSMNAMPQLKIEDVTPPRNRGRRTGLNVIKGEKIKIEDDGTQNFDDYWTDHNTTVESSMIVELSNCTITSTSELGNADDFDNSIRNEQLQDTESNILTEEGTPPKWDITPRKKSMQVLKISVTPVSEEVDKATMSLTVFGIDDNYDNSSNCSNESKSQIFTEAVDKAKMSLTIFGIDDNSDNSSNCFNESKSWKFTEEVDAAEMRQTAESKLKSNILRIEDIHVNNNNKYSNRKQSWAAKEGVDMVEPDAKARILLTSSRNLKSKALCIENAESSDKYYNRKKTWSVTEEVHATKMILAARSKLKSNTLGIADVKADNNKYPNRKISWSVAEGVNVVEPVAEATIVSISELESTSNRIEATNAGNSKISAVEKSALENFTGAFQHQGTRKSYRNRIAPLARWRNERQKFRYLKSGEIINIGIDSGTTEDCYMMNVLKKKHCNQKSKNKIFHKKKILFTNPHTGNQEKAILLKHFQDLWSAHSNHIIVKSGYTTVKSFSCGPLSFGFIKINAGCKKQKDCTKENIHFTITNGSLAARINNTQLKLGKNDSFIVPLGNSYSLYNCGKMKAVLSFCMGRWPVSDSQKNRGCK